MTEQVTRRGFLGMLSALPVVGALLPRREKKWIFANTGKARLYRKKGLYFKHGEYRHEPGEVLTTTKGYEIVFHPKAEELDNILPRILGDA